MIDCTLKRYNLHLMKMTCFGFRRSCEKTYWLKKFDGSCSDLTFMKNMTSEIIGKFCTEAYEFTKEKIRLKFMADIAVVYKFLNKLWLKSLF